jgi:hypothetical protein
MLPVPVLDLVPRPPRSGASSDEARFHSESLGAHWKVPTRGCEAGESIGCMCTLLFFRCLDLGHGRVRPDKAFRH